MTADKEATRITPVRIPQGMLFPVVANGPIRVDVETMDEDRFSLLMGGVGVTDGASNVGAQELTFAHQRLLLRILFGRPFDAPEVPINFSDLLPGASDGGNVYARMQRTLFEIANANVKVIREGRPDEITRLVTFRIQVRPQPGVDPADVAQTSIEGNIKWRKLKAATFAPEFWRACLNWAKCWPIRVDALDNISSDIAGAAYIRLAPNTHSRERVAGEYFKKDARTLLREIGLRSVEGMSLYEICRTFERTRWKHAGSVLAQMDGQPMMYGVFRVKPKLEMNVAGDGYNLIYWREAESDIRRQGDESLLGGGVLCDIFTGLGFSPKQFIDIAKPEWRRIETHEEEALSAVGYEIGSHRRYLELVRSRIGPARFQKVIATVRMVANDGNVRQIGEYVGAALKEEFTVWAKSFRATTVKPTTRAHPPAVQAAS